MCQRRRLSIRCFKTGKPFERHADRPLDALQVHVHQAVLIEERAVDPRLDRRPRQRLADLPHTVGNERRRTVGVMHVAAAVMQVEELAGLGDGAKQRVVAALSFLFFVESDGGPLGVASGAEHAAIEVERDARQLFGHQSCEHDLAEIAAQIGNGIFVKPGECAADG